MKGLTPHRIALLNAFLIAIIFGMAYSILSFLYGNFQLIPFLVYFFSIFISTYVIFNFSIEKFVYDRIKVIYKTIGRFKSTPSNREANKTRKKNDVLEIVNQVVLEWSEEKKKEIEELKEMAAYRREFLGNISHELRTPIFNIQGYISTLLEGGIDDPSINKKFLVKSEKSINRMIALVADLEDISKLESGELVLMEEKFDLIQLCREVIDFLEVKASKVNAVISLKTSPGRSVLVMADKKRVRQVFINLIDNALKYGAEGHSVVDISFHDFHKNYLIEVSDNGMGIPEELLPRVFERFYRTDTGRSRDKGGSGLGLAIVKHIIGAHRQTISARSKVGEGTTFSFTLLKA